MSLWLRCYTPNSVLTALGLTLAITIVGVMTFGDGQALASQVSCGDTINVDTKLEKDLVNCPDNGIVIGKDGITLDLNGHTVDGNDALIRECPGKHICDVGILDDGHAGVTVSGGRVKQFGTGVLVLAAKHASLERLAASDNHFNGVLFVGSMQSRLVRSTVALNGLETDFPGIAVVAGSRRILIADNISRQNADLGLFLTESDANRVVGNDFSNNPEAGMIVEGDANEITGNRVVGNGDGIVLGGTENTIAGNQISRSLGCGNGCGNGISLESGRDNLIARNDIRGASETGIRLLTFVAQQHLADNVVRRNSVRHVAGRGMLIGSGAKHTLLERNHVRRSHGNGISVKSATTELARNRADHNGGHGIVAVTGVTDGGGNEAAANGKSPPCVHIACA